MVKFTSRWALANFNHIGMQTDHKKIILGLVLAVILLAGINIFAGKKSSPENRASILGSVVQPASAKEIYPLFLCPCCGLALDPDNICCPMAQERIDYINSLTKEGKAKNEIILAFAKKYGLNSFADKNKQAEFKKELAKNAPADRPILTISPNSIDMGDISQKNGVAVTFFEIKNDGESDLVISRLDTSCGCTAASIVYNNQEGPKFAMAGHGTESPKDWQATIPAGQTARLKVYYDPNVHKDLIGPVTREIYIYSNDPLDFEKSIQVDLNQIK